MQYILLLNVISYTCEISVTQSEIKFDFFELKETTDKTKLLRWENPNINLYTEVFFLHELESIDIWNSKDYGFLFTKIWQREK